MRFFGRKTALLQNIDTVITLNTIGRKELFCDLFSGSTEASKYFKNKFQIISNDFLHFSFVLQKALIENNNIPTFEKLNKIGISDPLTYLEDIKINLNQVMNIGEPFICKNYSPNENCSRMYFSSKNALKIDFIRLTLESWKKQNLLNENEYFYLLASLIEAVSSISNTSGTYAAYLKNWDKRALQDMQLIRLDVIDNKRKNIAYNEDSMKLINVLEGDILYLDPPYNSRQYAPNYHLLETISKYDYPKITGITGMRPYENQKSPFSVKASAAEALEFIIDKAKFPNIVLSYSSEGLISKNDIENILKKYGEEQSYRAYSIPYKKYKDKKNNTERNLYEYIFYIRKNIFPINNYDMGYSKIPYEDTNKIGLPNTFIDRSYKKYIKSPFNYIGGKYRLLNQIISSLPNNIHTFFDLFSGGCNVAVNVNAEKIICNDINYKLIEIYNCFKEKSIDEILQHMENRIIEFGLTKSNDTGYMIFRNYYNRVQDPLDLFLLSCYSFNYQIRFNSEMKFNNPFGRNRSQFSENTKKNLILFIERIHKLNISFVAKDFRDIAASSYNNEAFVYCDPPYIQTKGLYNDGNRGFKQWTVYDELELYSYLDILNEKGVKFALSNISEYNGEPNNLLKKWAENYKIIELESASANSKNKKEILVVNYDNA